MHKVGTRVIFDPNPASLMLYRKPPSIGATGTVTTVAFPGGRRLNYLPGPGGGLLYVDWDDEATQGVAPRDVRVLRKGNLGGYDMDKLHARIARALGWKLEETESMSLSALREVVRPVNPKLAHEITCAIESGDALRGLGDALISETHTEAARRKIVKAFVLFARIHSRNTLRLYDFVFEHGQWWVTHRKSGQSWSVVDTERNPSYPGEIDFEEVCRGE